MQSAQQKRETDARERRQTGSMDVNQSPVAPQAPEPALLCPHFCRWQGKMDQFEDHAALRSQEPDDLGNLAAHDLLYESEPLQVALGIAPGIASAQAIDPAHSPDLRKKVLKALTILVTFFRSGRNLAVPLPCWQATKPCASHGMGQVTTAPAGNIEAQGHFTETLLSIAAQTEFLLEPTFEQPWFRKSQHDRASCRSRSADTGKRITVNGNNLRCPAVRPAPGREALRPEIG